MSANAHQPSPFRIFAISVVAAVLAALMMLSFGYADHAPAPHGVKIAVSAPTAVIAQAQTGLNRVEPGGFTLVPASGSSAATANVRSQRAAGGFVLPASGPATIITAGADGTSQQATITAAFTALATTLHRETRAVDVAPLPAGDRAGLSSFVFELGLLIPSVIGSIGIFLVGVRRRIWWRISAAALFAVLAGLASALVLDTVYGALSGSDLALIGVGIFGALAFALTVGGAQALLGLPGTGLAGLALIFLGNAISGGTVPVGFLPDGFRQLAPWLPNNAVIRAVRDVIYFNGHDLGHPLLVLGLWSAVALAIIYVVDLLHTRVRRHSAAHRDGAYHVTAIVLIPMLRVSGDESELEATASA